MPDPRFNQYHGNPQMGPDGALYFPDGSIARPDGSIYNPPTGPQHSALGGGTAGMSFEDRYNTMSGTRDQRRGGTYAAGGQVNPYAPPAGPYGSSNPGRRQKELEIANRYGPYSGIPHPLSQRSDAVESSSGHGGQVLEDKYTGHQTGKVTDPTSPHFGAEYNTSSHYYDSNVKLVRPNDDPAPPKNTTITKDPSPFMPSEGTPQENSIRNSVGNNLPPSSGSSVPGIAYPYAPPRAGNTVTPALPSIDETVVAGSPDSDGVIETGDPQYPKMSASLSIPISNFGIQDGKKHLQALYNKQRQLMEQGVNVQNNAAVRALRQRAVELDQHISTLVKLSSLMSPSERDERSQLPDDDPNKVWIIPKDTRPRLPDGSPSNNPNFPTMMPEQYEPWEGEGMQAYDWNDDGVLSQTEYRAFQKLKAQQDASLQGLDSGKATRHGSSTHRTLPGMMPGYSIVGGRDTTGTQHQGDGGINPNAPRFLGDGTMQPPQIPHGPSAPEYTPPAFPSEQGGEPEVPQDTYPYPPADVTNPNKQARMLAQQIANGEAIYRSVMQNKTIPMAIKSALAQLDADGNGYLSKKEMKSADSILGDIAGVVDQGNLPRGGLLERLRKNREERRNNRGR